jgi:hypothetical protein
MSAPHPSTEPEVRARLGEAVGCSWIDLVPGGPALVRGATSVADSEGTPHQATRPVVAVCTCGLTQREPWCDATHKVARAAR